MGNYDHAIDALDVSLHIGHDIGDEESQAVSLHQLSIVYISKADYEMALTQNCEAEAITRKLGDEQFLAAILHERGIIFIDLNRQQDAIKCFRAYL
jgi:tetratricopeptide (TPR) repeat protein